MRSLTQAFVLAMRDYRHEALLSACSVLGLAAVLAPLMVLLGVHHGIISAMTERLLSDPRTLEVTPVGSGKYGPEWFAELAALPETSFVIPQTRSIAATMNLRNPARPGLQTVTPLTASDAGDPLLTRWSLAAAGWTREAQDAAPSASLGQGSSPAGAPLADPAALSSAASSSPNPLPADSLPAAPPGIDAAGGTDGASGVNNASGTNDASSAPGGDTNRPRPTALVVLSESAARKIGAEPGALLEGRLDRVRSGRRESASLPLRVAAVLPAEAQSTDVMYVPLELLVASEDYRDGLAVPFVGWSGDTPRQQADSLASYAAQARQQRVYASFRVYASSLDGVNPLWRWFQERHVEVYVKAAEIENVKSLDRAFTVVFGLITLAAVFGFCASTASSALAGVRRKSRSLGIMRLIGFPRAGILLFPVSQTVATGFFGFLLALVLYLGVAVSIDTMFAGSLPGGESVCTMPVAYALAVCAVVIVLSAVSSLAAAWQATTIEPSEVIRDV